jgi:hypothetical protein
MGSVVATMAKTMALGGVAFNENPGSTVTGDAMIVHSLSVGVTTSADGTLTTRTSDTAGTLTMDDSGHGIETGDRLDIYWTGGVAYGATVGVVSGASVPFTLAEGDVLPSALTDVTAFVPVELDIGVLGTNVVAIILHTTIHGMFVFDDAGGIELAKELGDGVTWSWREDNGEANPITGDTITKVYVSHDGDAAATMKVGILYDN